MDAKSRILKAGAWIVNEKGFNGTGLAELLEAAKIPKGSFYFYFKNKEDFGLHLIDYFVDYLKGNADVFYQDENLSHLEKIRSVFRWQAETFRKGNFKGGCPIGNLSQEMGDRNQKFRKKLDKAMATMKEDLAAHLERAQNLGEISKDMDIHEAADFIFNSWEGALMQMKVSKNTVAHEVFDRMVFERLLKAELFNKKKTN
jgi:TetR/AcrR family transcriptional repressor of nem operon